MGPRRGRARGREGAQIVEVASADRGQRVVHGLQVEARREHGYQPAADRVVERALDLAHGDWHATPL